MIDPHRETCRRQHQIVGNYLAIQAWLAKLDCIVLNRNDLESFMKLKRFKSIRVEWLKSDLAPWFPYKEAYYKTGALASIHSLFLSRVPIKQFLPTGSMTTSDRIKGMEKDSPPTKLLEKAVKEPLYDEGAIIAKLSLFASGVDAPPRPSKYKRKQK
jgi:hypothetical protein